MQMRTPWASIYPKIRETETEQQNYMAQGVAWEDAKLRKNIAKKKRKSTINWHFCVIKIERKTQKKQMKYPERSRVVTHDLRGLQAQLVLENILFISFVWIRFSRKVIPTSTE